ncbi:hypothetical protein Kazakh3177_03050 [Helicobacter pylori]
MIALSDVLLYMAAPRQVAKKLTFKESSLNSKLRVSNIDSIILKINKIVTTS